MAYEKQNFEPEQVLSAAQLNHIEDGIAQIEENVQQELEDVKKRGADVKEELAEIISEKGVETASDLTFDEMFENARRIKTGGGFDALVSSLPGYVIKTSSITSTVYTEEVTEDDD